jgi:class 3 adenylate cyclase
VALAIDAVFVVDLLGKLLARGRSYLLTPWFLIDLFCALPVLSTLSAAPAGLQGLRPVRMFRMLRALRMLRVLRSLRVLQGDPASADTEEQRRYHRVLGLGVSLYALAFVGLVTWLEGSAADPTHAREQELLLVVGSLLGMALILVVSRYQVHALGSRQLRALLNVALPAQVAEHFLQHPEAYDRSVRMPATVMFCDIKGFTSTVERIDLDQLKVHLEAALDAVVEAHMAHDLIIDKFIGDAVMSFRGGDLVQGDAADHARRVVLGALHGRKALADLDDPYFREVKVGGASAPDALIGTFGASKRLSYTVLGDRVNLAARLEGSCNALGVRSLFCDQTRGLVGADAGVVWRRVGQVRVQGRDEVCVAWEAFLPEEVAADAPWLLRYHEALDAWAEGQLDAAREGFEAVRALRPVDGLTQRYLAACDRWSASDPAAFDPVLATTK